LRETSERIAAIGHQFSACRPEIENEYFIESCEKVETGGPLNLENERAQ